MVTAGHTSRNLREARKEKGFQSFGVKEFYYHPKYDRKPNRFDILLIEIKPVQAKYNNPANNFGWTFTKKVQPLCISDKKDEKVIPRDHCFITGWGLTSPGQVRPEKGVQQARVRVNDERCINDPVERTYGSVLRDTLLCSVGYRKSNANACEVGVG